MEALFWILLQTVMTRRSSPGEIRWFVLKGLEDPLSELHSSSQQSIHREMPVVQTAFRTESRQTRRCLIAGPQYDLLIAPATCSRLFPSLRQDQYRPCESEFRSVVDCRQAA